MAEATPSESAGDPAYSQPGVRGSGRRRTASRVAAARSPNATPGSGAFLLCLCLLAYNMISKVTLAIQLFLGWCCKPLTSSAAQVVWCSCLLLNPGSDLMSVW